MSFFCITDILQSSKKAYSIQRDIPAISMNTHIILYV